MEILPVQFITGLFGGGGNTILTMILALGIVLVLIVLAAWLLRLLSNVSGNAARGRNRRLSVVDNLAIDQKRQLLIIRRDNVEHLILTGGPQDLVVETGIPVEEQAPAMPARRPLPIMGGRKPAPEPKPGPVPPVEPAVTPAQAAAPGTLLEQLQKSGHSGERKTRVSLRHTGLLRPVTTQDPTLAGQKPDISAEPSADSAKEDNTSELGEGGALGHDKGSEANRN